MEIRLLGPLEVRGTNGIISLPRRQQRALLATLALRCGETVSTERLVADLWGENPPPSASGSLQNTVSALRKLVGRDVLVTQAPGYRLAVGRDSVDTHRFERLVNEAREAEPAAAARLLGEALALWRGPALADLAEEGFAKVEATRLDELRVAAQEERIDAELALGRHAALVGELEQLVTTHPLRERLRAQLMLALYRCGRQAEALEVYRAARLALADELGLDPSPELKELERRILRQDASLAITNSDGRPAGRRRSGAQVTVVAAEPALTIVGRQEELAEIDRRIAAAARGRSTALLIRGEPGIGKSALLAYAAARADRARILRTCGIESEAEFGFAGLAALLEPVTELISRLPDAQAGALVDALGVGPALPGDPFAVSVATLNLLSSAAESGPLLVLVDDAHWLDAPSQQALLFCARRLELDGVALVIALRDDQPTLFDQTELPAIRLGPLSRRESERLLDRGASTLQPDARRAVLETAGGNPLALVELPSLLLAREHAGGLGTPVPLPAGEAVTTAFRLRLQGLDAEERQALLVAAADDTQDVDVVRLALAALDVPEDALERAESEGAVTLGPPLAFRHPLLRSLVYHSASSADRRRVHGALAEVLAARGFEARGAWHAALASTRADPGIAAALERVADDARSRGAFGAAAAAAERAARLTPDREERARLLTAAAGDAQLTGGIERANALLEQALELTSDPLLRTGVQELRARGLLFAGRPMDAHALLVDAGERLQETHPDRAALLFAQAAPLCSMAGRIDRGLETGRRAVEVAARGSESAQARAELALAQILQLTGDAEGGARLRDRVRERPRLDDTQMLTDLMLVGAGHLMVLGEHDAARASIDHLVALARSASAPGLLPFPLATLAEIEFRTGRWAAALSAATESLELARQTGQIPHVAYSLMIRARILAARGLPAEAEAALQEAAVIGEAGGIGAMLFYVPAARAFAALGAGDLELAASEANEVETIAHERGLGEPGVVLWPPDLVEALAGLERLAEARRVLRRFESRADATGRGWALATAARCRGILADADTFELEFEVALERHGRLDMPFELARTQLCLGERRSRAGGDAARPLRAALATFEQLGAHPWAARAAAELRALGETVSLGEPPPADLLTERELRVALAIASGSPPEEVAGQLFLTPNTVEAHARSVYEKLGVRSSDELALLLAGAPAIA